MHCIKPGSVRWFWASFTSLHVSGEKWSWPSPVAMNALEKFFTPEEMEMKVYSILLDSSSFLNHRLTLSTAWNHRSQGGGWVMALLISAQTVCEGTALSVSYSLHAGNGARNILAVGPTPPAALQSRQAGIQLCSFCGERHLSRATAWDGEWVGSSHLLLHLIPTRPVWSHRENIWQPVPSVCLDASPKGGKTEPGLSQQQSFECWQLYSQHDWYSDHKLCFLRETINKRYGQVLCWFDSVSQRKFNLETKSRLQPSASQSIIDVLPLTLISHQFTPA